MKLLSVFLLSLAMIGIATGQGTNYSATTGDVSLSGSGTAFTIQQPATNGHQVQFQAAVVYCSVACSVSQAQNGAAATTTAGTAYPLLPSQQPARATVWTASNVGAGTPAGGILHVAAASFVVIDLSQIGMGNTGTGTNYTVSVAAITGTANITLFWGEK